MGNYSITDFEVGDSVYHLSNSALIMVVIVINKNPDEISCRWIDKTGKSHVEDFLPQELGKASDLSLGVYLL